MAEFKPKELIYRVESDAKGMGIVRTYQGELVRCKDCKHTKDDGCGAIYCKKWDRWEMPEDYFCADGERR